VISGGPGTGKTSVINELRNEFEILEEAARNLGDNDERFKGKSIREIEPQDFQDAIFEEQRKQILILQNEGADEVIFSDRGLGDTLAYYKFRGLNISEKIIDFCKEFRYAGIFVLDFLKEYKRDTLRQETEEELRQIHEMIIQTYSELGYKIIFVPCMPVAERVKFIKEKVLSDL